MLLRHVTTWVVGHLTWACVSRPRACHSPCACAVGRSVGDSRYVLSRLTTGVTNEQQTYSAQIFIYTVNYRKCVAKPSVSLPGPTSGLAWLSQQRPLSNCKTNVILFIGPIPWDHSGPLCHALSLSSLSSRTTMRRRRATVPLATPGEWA